MSEVFVPVNTRGWSGDRKGGSMAAIVRKSRLPGIVAASLVLLLFLHGVQATEREPVIETGETKGTITIASFIKIIEENSGSILLIDVREPEEYASGTLKTAINIPIDDLEDKIDSLPADKPVVYICSTGERSEEAYDMTVLMRDDLRVYYLYALLSIDKDGSYKIEPIAQ
jgi:rhodanese-related sulfurtransferase